MALLTGAGREGKTVVFHEMRRGDRALDKQETENILATGTYGVLSVVGTNNYGYGVPLSYVYKNNSIYIHCALEDEKVSALIALVDKYASDDNYKTKGREKAVREADRTVVLRLDIEQTTGKARE